MTYFFHRLNKWIYLCLFTSRQLFLREIPW